VLPARHQQLDRSSCISSRHAAEEAAHSRAWNSGVYLQREYRRYYRGRSDVMWSVSRPSTIRVRRAGLGYDQLMNARTERSASSRTCSGICRERREHPRARPAGFRHQHRLRIQYWPTRIEGGDAGLSRESGLVIVIDVDTGEVLPWWISLVQPTIASS